MENNVRRITDFEKLRENNLWVRKEFEKYMDAILTKEDIKTISTKKQKMTAQATERINYKGKDYHMASEPLDPILWRKNIKLPDSGSNCWRGYIGEWLIDDGKLYLVALTDGRFDEEFEDNYDVNEKRLHLNDLFENEEKVFADWYTGNLVLWEGEMLKYHHIGYRSLFERDIVLRVVDGVITSERIFDNRKDFEDGKITMARDYNNLSITSEDLF